MVTSEEIYDALQRGVGNICGAEEALLSAAHSCLEALAELNGATAGSTQPEVMTARRELLQADHGLQVIGNLLMRSAMAFADYSTKFSPQDNEPVRLSPVVQAYLEQGSPYANAGVRDDDQDFVPGPLLSAAYAQYPTSLTIRTMEGEDDVIISIPNGQVQLNINPHTHQGTTAYVEFVEVTAGQQQGRGTHLLQMAGREASLRGADTLSGCYISPYSLRALANAVGRENIIIRSPSNTRDYIQSTDYGEAVAALDEQEADTSSDRDLRGVFTHVNLHNANVQSRLFRR